MRNSYKLCTRYGISWWLFGLFLFIILARNIDCKSILQKTLNQIGLVDSKFERKSRYKSNFQCVSLPIRVCICPHMCRAIYIHHYSPLIFHFLLIITTEEPKVTCKKHLLHRSGWKINRPEMVQWFLATGCCTFRKEGTDSRKLQK